MRALVRVALLLALVLGAIWIAQHVDLERSRAHAEDEVRGAVKKVEETVPDLDVKAIAEELKRTGRVVRRRAGEAVAKVAEATDDARTTAAIKAKLALDPQLSVFDVSVNTAGDWVTLAGRVDSAAQIARAIRIAFERDEVREVISTLQVRPTGERSRRRKVTVVR
jgi:osmotically-inducible protein OsmY